MECLLDNIHQFSGESAVVILRHRIKVSNGLGGPKSAGNMNQVIKENEKSICSSAFVGGGDEVSAR